jgi:hypothetical protein
VDLWSKNQAYHSIVEGDAMINRRQILLAATAGAAMMTRIPNAQAATYDLLIKGGRVIDPSIGLDAVRDVAIAAGRIVSVEADIVGDVIDTIDARAKIVAPGLIDIHTHAGRGKDSPALALQDGVTSLVDAGSGDPTTSTRSLQCYEEGRKSQGRDAHRLHRQRTDGYQPGRIPCSRSHCPPSRYRHRREGTAVT